MTETATWEFEPADPEVGFFTDSLYHTCEANLEDPEPAEETSRSLVNAPDGKTVVESVLFTCPVCAATTTGTTTWPRWMFEESGD